MAFKDAIPVAANGAGPSVKASVRPLASGGGQGGV